MTRRASDPCCPDPGTRRDPGKTARGRTRRASLPAATVLVALVAGAADAAPPSSPSYVLRQSTMTSSGRTVTSSSYVASSSLGQEAVIGTSSSTGYVLQSGFWSFVGSGLVPVLLMVTKNGANPYEHDLDWTGNNPPYKVYRSLDCTDVFGGGVHATSMTKQWTDVAPPPDPLVCYNVQATAPGPIAPPLESGRPPGAIEALPPAAPVRPHPAPVPVRPQVKEPRP